MDVTGKYYIIRVDLILKLDDQWFSGFSTLYLHFIAPVLDQIRDISFPRYTCPKQQQQLLTLGFRAQVRLSNQFLTFEFFIHFSSVYLLHRWKRS